MPEAPKPEELSASLAKSQAELAEALKKIENLNTECAGRRKAGADLEAELERIRRSGEDSARKAAREEIGKEYEAKLEALKQSHVEELGRATGELRRLNLEGAAVKAGIKPEIVGDAIRLLPENTAPEKAMDAFKELGKRIPGMLANQGGGPNDSPGSRGGGGLPPGEPMPKTIRELTHDANGRPTADRLAAFMRDHPDEYARLRAATPRIFHGGVISELAPVEGPKPQK